MSTTVDSFTVEARFNNKQFEAGAKETMGTLQKLKEALKLPSFSKNFAGIQKASNQVDMHGLTNAIEDVKGKFSTLEVAARTALTNIVNRAVDAGIQLGKSLSIDQVTAGFKEYELKMGSIQTIMASTGESLETVNGYLQELNEYSDKTIYSFSDMTQNIGKFTNAGVSLEDSVKAIQGISNAAAVAGANSNEASRAMYNFAQALSSGSVKLMDWKSIELANMGTVEFKQQLLDTAVAMGTVVKEGDKYVSTTTDLNGKVSDLFNATSMFNDSLSTQWLTTDVLVQTLSNYSTDVRRMTDAEKDAYEEKLRSIGYTEDQIKAIEELGVKAFNSAQDVKTFTQLIDTMRESVGSGWAQTFELIFGDFEEARKLWTNVNNVLGSIIQESSDSRNELLRGWKEAGGRDALLGGISNAFNSLLSIVKAVNKAFRNVFPKMTGEQLANITKGFESLTSKLTLSEGTLDKITRTASGFFSILNIVKKAISALFKILLPGVSMFDDLGGGILDVTAAIGDWISNLDEAIDKNDGFTKVVEKLSKAVEQGLKSIGDFGRKMIKMMSSSFNFKGTSFEDILNKISNAFSNLSFKLDKLNFKKAEDSFDKLQIKVQGLSGLATSSAGFGTFVKNFKQFGEELKNATAFDSVLERVEKIRDVFSKFFDWFKEFSSPLLKLFKNFDLAGAAAAAGGVGIIYAMVKVSKAIETVMLSITSVQKALAKAIGNFSTSLTGTLGSIKDVLTSYQKDLKASALIKVAGAIAILAAAIFLLSFADTDRLLKASEALSLIAGTLLIGFAKLSDALNRGTVLMNPTLQFAKGIRTALSKLGRAFEIRALGGAVKNFAISVGIIAAAIIALGIMYKKDKESLLAAVDLVKAIVAVMVAIMAGMSILGNFLKGGGMKNFAKAASGMFMLSLSLGICIGALNKLFEMEFPSDWKFKISILTDMLIELGVLSIVLGAASRLAGKGGLKTSNIVAMAGLLIVTVLALDKLFKMEFPSDWQEKVTLLGLIFAGIGGLMITLGVAARLAGGSIKAAGTILAVCIFLGVVVGSLLVLTIIPSEKMLEGAIGLGLVLAALGVALYGAGKITSKDTYKSILAMAIMVGAIVAALGILSIIPFDKLLAGAVALGAILLVLSEDFKQASKITNTKTLVGIVAMGAVVAAIAAALYVLSEQPWSGMLAGAVALSSVLLAMSGAFMIISKSKPNPVAIAAFLAASVSVGLIAFAIYELAKQPWQNLLATAASLSLVLVAMGAALGICTMVGATAPAAVIGVGLLYAFILTFAGLLAAMGAIFKSKDAQNLISGGAQMLVQIGNAIGSFVGSIVAGFATMVSSALPQIGEDLSAFMDNLQPFISGAKGIDSGMATNVGILAAAFLALTAGEILSGIARLFGLSLSDVGFELSKFMISLQPFIQNSKGLNENTAKACENIGKMVLALTASEIIAGIGRFFGIGGNIGKFGEELASFGPHIKEFADTVKGVDPDSVQGAAAAAEIMAEMAKKLPGSGGLAQKLFGEKSLEEFGKALASFGPHIKKFGDTVRDVKPDHVQGAASAAEIMANLANKLPAQQGLVQKLFGEKSLAEFGRELVSFGPHIKKFGDTVKDVTPEAVQGAAAAAEIMSNLANNLPDSQTLWDKIFGGGQITLSQFGEELVKFGGSINEFASKISVETVENMTAATTAFKSLVELIAYMDGVSPEAIVNFSNQLDQIGVESVNNFVRAFSDAQPKATNAVNGVFNSAMTALNSGGIKVKNTSITVGNTLGQGLQTGINQSRPGVISTETNLANSMIGTMRSSLPNSTFSSIGQNVTNATSNGINSGRRSVEDAAANVGRSATDAVRSNLTHDSFHDIGANAASGLSGGISSRIGDIASSAIDAARAAVDAAKNALGIQSPSKVFKEIGEYVSLGLSGGILNKVSNVEDASHDLASTAIDTVRTAIGQISEEMENGDSIYRPTISPVFDLSNATTAANQISSRFRGLDLSTTMGLAQNVSYDINRNRLKSFDKESQNNKIMQKKLDQFMKDNQEGAKVENTNTFYIQSTDPKQAAEEVGYIMQHKVERGKAAWAK